MPDPFITREELGTRIGKDLSTSEKALQCVEGACDIVRTVTEQAISLVQDDEVVVDGSGGDALLLPEMPVVDVSDVAIRDVDSLEADDWELDTRKGALVRVDTGTWPKARRNVTVTYSHGWADADIPRDIRMVALAVAARLMRADDVLWEGNEIAGVRLGVLPTDLSAGELRILHKYRRRG
jgi:hypothetical protein